MAFAINTIHQGHVVDILREWPSDSIHCIITSPPYWKLRDYDTEPQVWGGDPECEHEWDSVVRPADRGTLSSKSGWARTSREINPALNDSESQYCGKCGAWHGSLGDEPTVQQYVANIREVFSEALRVLHPDGSMFIVIADSYHGHGLSDIPSKSLAGVPERVVLMMQDELGMVRRNTLIWKKNNAIPSSQTDRWTVDFEYVYFMTKEERYYHLLQQEPCEESSLRQNGWGPVGGKKYEDMPTCSGENAVMRPMRTMRTVWSIPTASYTGAHFAVFPVRLVEPMVEAACPERVCAKCGRPYFPVYGRIVPDGTKGRYLSDGKFRQNPHMALDASGHTGRCGEASKIVERWEKRCDCETDETLPGIVLDIFAGSGTTLKVAKAKGRRWVGIELNPDFIELAQERIDVPQTTLEDWLDEKRWEEGQLEERLKELTDSSYSEQKRLGE